MTGVETRVVAVFFIAFQKWVRPGTAITGMDSQEIAAAIKVTISDSARVQIAFAHRLDGHIHSAH